MLLFGFFSQIGRGLGRDVYSTIKNSNGSYVDPNDIDNENAGASDSNGRFYYDGYEYVSFWKCIGLLLGVAIPFVNVIIVLMLLYKALVRIFSKKVRFYSTQRVAVHKADGRAKYGTRIIGYNDVKVPFKKTFDEASLGVPTDGKSHSPIWGTKISNAIYLILALGGIYYCFNLYLWMKDNSHKAELREERYKMENAVLQSKIVCWTDTIIIDNFTQKVLDKYSYKYPSIVDSVFTFYADGVLVKKNGNVFLYTKYTQHDGVDCKLYKGGRMTVVSLQKYDYKDIIIRLHKSGSNDEMKYDRCFVAPKSFATADSILCRISNRIHKFE